MEILPWLFQLSNLTPSRYYERFCNAKYLLLHSQKDLSAPAISFFAIFLPCTLRSGFVLGSTWRPHFHVQGPSWGPRKSIGER